jgi:hypothetical protein
MSARLTGATIGKPSPESTPRDPRETADVTTRQHAFREALLHGTPDWSRWDRDENSLVERLIAYVNTDGTPPRRQRREHHLARDVQERQDARARAFWLLDRLLGPEIGPWEAWRDADLYARHAWARRLGARRDEMLGSGDPSTWGSAWVQTCADADPSELLRFYAAGWRGSRAPWGRQPLDAFVARVRDPAARREALLPLARARGGSRARAVLLRDAAAALGPPDVSADEANQPWLRDSLRGDPDLAALLREDDEDGLARAFWIWRCDDRDRLDRETALTAGDSTLIERYAQLLPRDEVAWWVGLVDEDLRTMQRFVRWLDPAYASALLPYVDDRDPWRAEMAWRCWVHDTPEPVLRAISRDTIPAWRGADLDRWLCAPRALRFPRVGPTDQERIWDVAVRDPFSRCDGRYPVVNPV